MPRIALYTALIGNYERPSEMLTPNAVASNGSSGVDFFRFTDATDARNAVVRGDNGLLWHEIHVRPRIPMDPIRSARAIKILGNSLLSDYDATVWIDNRILLKVRPCELLDRVLPSGADLAVPLHSYRDTLAHEFDAIIEGFIDDPHRVREQRLVYSKCAPALLTQQIPWTAILIRRNNPAIHAFSSFWWEQVLRYSRRDQLSFSYACDNFPDLKFAYFSVDNHQSDVHVWPKPSEVGRAPHGGGFSPHGLTSEVSDHVRSLKFRLRRQLSRGRVGGKGASQT